MFVIFLVSNHKVFLNGYLCFPTLALAPGPNLYLTASAPNLYFTVPALNLYLPALALNLCSPVLRFTVKVLL